MKHFFKKINEKWLHIELINVNQYRRMNNPPQIQNYKTTVSLMIIIKNYAHPTLVMTKKQTSNLQAIKKDPLSYLKETLKRKLERKATSKGEYPLKRITYTVLSTEKCLKMTNIHKISKCPAPKVVPQQNC